MKNNIMKFTIAFFLTGVLLVFPILNLAQKPDGIKPPKLPDISKGRGLLTKGVDDTDKLSPELKMLYAQYKTGTRDSKSKDEVSPNYTAAQLAEIFGIMDEENKNPEISIAVKTGAGADFNKLKQAGMKIYMQLGDSVYGRASVLSLGEIVSEKSVNTVEVFKAASVPKQPSRQKISSALTNVQNTNVSNTRSGNTTTLANEFNKAALTGKGVIIGVVDTGIDWRHPDFRKPDGTSRILAIWDMTDESYRTQKIGSAPPTLFAGGDQLYGTIYTQEQINAALRGNGTVNTGDTYGHGTAVASTAAGSAPNMIGNFQTSKYSGVAPDADLIIVRASGCGGFGGDYIFGAVWITQMAKSLKRPVVANLSLGGHISSHDGTEEEEQILNQLTGKGKPGVVFTVSAGNEGLFNMHATGMFGARRPGQEDIDGTPVVTTVLGRTQLLGVFDARDDWGVYVRNLQSAMEDNDEKQMSFMIYKVGGTLRYQLKEGLDEPSWFRRYMETAISASSLGSQTGRRTDFLRLNLPEGMYVTWGFGASEKVTSGAYSLYLPGGWNAGFGTSTVKAGMVGSPGNATNVITVGAYNFRRNWLNNTGGTTLYNFMLGEISDYSSPGGKRMFDGVVKPDISAPATYTISALSQDVSPQSCVDRRTGEADNMLVRPNVQGYITPDGKHIAWDGTSASAPFTAGVIALMLQKNPNLDAEQVRQILIKTAGKGGIIGAVPNPAWGWGMLNPATAIANTPVGKKTAK